MIFDSDFDLDSPAWGRAKIGGTIGALFGFRYPRKVISWLTSIDID